jgi:hypothetical protein
MLLRGGIASGSVITQRPREGLNITKHFVVSPALTHAVEIERATKGQRLLLSANERQEKSHFWNSDIKAICYDEPGIVPSKLFTKYKYSDLLWARDLRKNPDDAKAETKKLIAAAEALFRNNYKKSASVRMQYAETLRICLLSLGSQLERTDLAIVGGLVDNTLLAFPDASVWLGFLEMVLMSRDGFAFHTNVSMGKFLRTAIMRGGEWGKVSEALSRQEHLQLRIAVEEFVATAIHR